MPVLALIGLEAIFAGTVYNSDPRENVRRMAKGGVVAGAILVTLVAMATFGPMVALILFALFVAASFLTKFWS